MLITFAQRIQSLLTPPCGDKAMLGTFASAGKEVFTLAAVNRKAIAFFYAKAEEFGLALQVGKVLGADVAEAVLGVYEMVTHVDVAIVLHHESIATRGAEGAERGLHTAPLGQSNVEELHEALAHIIDDPLVEHVAHELAEGFRGDAPGGYL